MAKWSAALEPGGLRHGRGLSWPVLPIGGGDEFSFPGASPHPWPQNWDTSVLPAGGRGSALRFPSRELCPSRSDRHGRCLSSPLHVPSSLQDLGRGRSHSLPADDLDAFSKVKPRAQPWGEAGGQPRSPDAGAHLRRATRSCTNLSGPHGRPEVRQPCTDVPAQRALLPAPAFPQSHGLFHKLPPHSCPRRLCGDWEGALRSRGRAGPAAGGLTPKRLWGRSRGASVSSRTH